MQLNENPSRKNQGLSEMIKVDYKKPELTKE